jgi:hypothetical protein
MNALTAEFEHLRDKTADLSWCNKCWWETESLEFSDWLLVDAWYRSRSLELPKSGESLVPGLDIANHSSEPNAYYEQNSNGVSLILRPGIELDAETEVTISYGDTKSAAEMLFSYGFIDVGSTNKELVLALDPFPDDPLGKAKVVAFKKPAIVRITEVNGTIIWESAFLYLACLNEEDGLEFRMLQETNGSRSPLRVFWQESDVTDETTAFESLIENHELKEVFKLRAVALLQARLQEQLERLYEAEEHIVSLTDLLLLTPSIQTAALQYVLFHDACQLRKCSNHDM